MTSEMATTVLFDQPDLIVILKSFDGILQLLQLQFETVKSIFQLPVGICRRGRFRRHR